MPDKDSLLKQKVLKLIASAKDSVIVLTNEGGFFSWPMVMDTTLTSLANGIKWVVYGNRIPDPILQKLKLAGADAYIGKRQFLHHFILVDGSRYYFHKHDRYGDRFGEKPALKSQLLALIDRSVK